MLPLWDYARAIYAEPAIQTRLLSLQDRFRLDVDLILWAIWCGRYGLELEENEANYIVSTVADMAEHTTRPLRGVRRFLTLERAGFPQDAQQALRQKVLELEIASEELVLKRLDTATLNLTQPKPDLGGVAERAEQLFIMARVSMDMPTVIADEEASFSPIGLFRELLKLAEDHGP